MGIILRDFLVDILRGRAKNSRFLSWLRCGEIKYFSDCILNGTDPEPDGEEGYADVRVLEGVLAALKSGGAVQLPPFTRTKRISTKAQKMELPAVSTPNLVDVSNPGKGINKQAKN